MLDESGRSRGFRVGDRVLVSSQGSKYKGRYGTIVVGKNGSCFTSTFLSAYVQLERDGVCGISSPYRALRCESLVFAPPVSRDEFSSSGVPFPVAYGKPVNKKRELMREMCAQLDALALRSEDEEDGIIVAFALAILCDTRDTGRGPRY